MQKHESLSEDKTRKRILFVNDDEDTAAVIKEGLSMHGYEVETFVDSNLALQNFKASNYDLLLLDVRMRGLNGFELYNQLRKIDKNIQICFISASNTFYEKYKRLIAIKILYDCLSTYSNSSAFTNLFFSLQSLCQS